jgi:8-oxo-dGTP pyrophosphatase MutT (NUDIX family)
MNHEDYYKGYSLGFLFSDNLKHVVLIRKARPAFQKGKLNGVGGKIEPGESHVSAMIREFREETGHEHRDWSYLRSFKVPNTFVHVFYGVGDIDKCKAPTDENVWKIPVSKVLKTPWRKITISAESVRIASLNPCSRIKDEDLNGFEIDLLYGVSVLVQECLDVLKNHKCTSV